MTTRDQNREHIIRLLQEYTTSPSTEEMLYRIAEPSGMLAACKWLSQQYQAQDRESKAWFEAACQGHQVKAEEFLAEIEYVLSLFTPAQAGDAALYALFDLHSGAGREALKQRYRQLCRRYHPDAVSGADKQDTEAFIAITQAYRTLLGREQEGPTPVTAAINHHWQQQSDQQDRQQRTKRSILWFSLVALALAVVSLVAAHQYNTHLMMTGLRNKGTAFVPPARKTSSEDERAPQRPPGRTQQLEVAPVVAEAVTPPPVTATVATFSPDPEKLAAATVVTATPAASRPVDPGPVAAAPVEKATPSAPALSAPLAAVSPPANPTLAPRPAEAKPGKKEAVLARPQVAAALAPAKDPAPTLDRPGKKLVKESQAAPPPPPPAKVVATATEKKAPPPPTAAATTVDQQHQPPPEAVAPAAPPPPPEEQIREKIESFLQAYSSAYRQKNLLAFSRFFTLDATENGKPLQDIMKVYTQLFESTESIRLGISLHNWQQDKDLLRIHGRFGISLVYKDGKKVLGRGVIDFKIADDRGRWQIKTLTYAFDD